MVDDLLVWLGKGQGESKNHFGDTRPVSSSGATYARAAVDATSVKGSGNLPENYNYTRLITWPEEVWYTVLFGNEPRGVRSNPARCFSLLSVFSLRTRELPSKPLRLDTLEHGRRPWMAPNLILLSDATPSLFSSGRRLGTSATSFDVTRTRVNFSSAWRERSWISSLSSRWNN